MKNWQGTSRQPNTEYHLQYIYTFMRKVGVLTDPVKSGKSTVACPHCGAPTKCYKLWKM